MKKCAILSAIGVAAVLSAYASGTTQFTGLDNRIHKLTASFAAMQQNPDKRIPADLLRQAQGIILLNRIQAGFGFAFEGGSGLALVKDAHGDWSPPAFFSAAEASLGFQGGGDQHFSVILLMTANATHELAHSCVNFGGEARGIAGDQSAGAESPAAPMPSTLVYGDRDGFYAGVAMRGGTISPDNEANAAYYGRPVTINDILFANRVKPTPAAAELIRTISQYSQP